MTDRSLYLGYAISKIGKAGTIKIPQLFGDVLSKNSGDLRMFISKSFTENCWVCYDSGILILDIDQARYFIYPRNLKPSESVSDLDRSMLSTFFLLNVSLDYSFKLPAALAGSFIEGEQAVFLSMGHSFEIWKIDDLLNSKHIHKNLRSLIEREKIGTLLVNCPSSDNLRHMAA